MVAVAVVVVGTDMCAIETKTKLAYHAKRNEKHDELDNYLWRRISSFQLDEPDSPLPFSMRLARENGWSRNFACRVTEEYKRFCFVAITANHSVTPSDEVDQAWHLHLLYTRSYWDEFCTHALGRPLHHSPTRGGSAEVTKYREWYMQTMKSYERAFGPPPCDIWPDVEERFARSRGFLRVNLENYWAVPRPRYRLIKRREH
jgi:hypothetical protein